VHFFWADERCLPPDNAENNFKTANELLFAPLGIAEENIHRLKGELAPEIAVGQANSEILRVVPKNATGLPVLDLILLGMGEDGHVASLFPHAAPEVEKTETPYLFIPTSPKPPPQRISLSYAAIAAAKEVWVLASGRGKEQALKDSVAKNSLTPLGKVLHARTQTKIFTDISI
jgi:6-phosphogluconolactonase